MDDESRSTRREALATLLIIGAISAAAIGRPIARKLARHPSRERCAAMLDRYAEQTARAYERAPTPRASAAPEAPPSRLADVARCTRELTDDEVECALKAGYADELERCLPP